MAKSKGNMELYKHGFTTDKPEACTAHVGLRVPPSVKEKLKTKDGWQEKVRNYIEQLVELESA